jgi:hypothetical protein
MWLPETDAAVPAIFEYIPYRKNDWQSVADSTRHPYFAGHGYACVRVDLRGSGDSEGILYDEYLPQEQDDGVDAIAWIAAQPWCSGAVGMIGRSWGGFNSLQVAARRPPALGAVVTICSTDDRYADDVHYIGGSVLAANMLSWASMMLAYNARPPDPRSVGERWREMWLERLERTPPFIEPWLAHQRRDEYWKHASVCEDYAAIQCPVYAVGGWVDGYPSAVFRLMEGLDVPRKALVGPWSHDWPQDGVPGPAIGFLQEVLRWWDHWLKGEDTEVLDEPMIRVWLQESVPPSMHYETRPGRWVAEPSWPSPNVAARSMAHGSGTISSGQATGRDAGEWCAWCGWGGTDNLPPDQRWEDSRSLVFDSDRLDDSIEILGFPEAVLTVSSNRPNALVAARLCDVAPDGASTLVTRGLLNLTHREGHEYPQPLVPGTQYTVRVPMRAIAYTFPPGHQVRLALSPTYWPWAWPSPEAVELTIEGCVELPVRTSSPHEPEFPPFEAPEISPPIPVEILAFGGGRRHECDSETKMYMLRNGIDQMPARRFVDAGLTLTDEGEDVYRIRDDDPLSAEVRCERRLGFVRDDWNASIDASSTMTAGRSMFRVTCRLRASEADREVFSRTWAFEIPRDHG